MGIFSKLLRRPSKRAPRNPETTLAEPNYRRFESRKDARVPVTEDRPTRIDREAYRLIYEQPVTYQPLLKMSEKCGGFTPVAIGTGKRRDQIQEILDNCIGVPEAIQFLYFADVEGVRFNWMRLSPVRQMNVINFQGGAEVGVHAGGSFWWGGYGDESTIRLGHPARISEEDSILVPRNRVLVFCPTALNDPQGDRTLGVNLTKEAQLAVIWRFAVTVYAERHGLPRDVIYRLLDELDPDSVDGAFTAALGATKDANFLHSTVLDKKDALELIEPNGKTWEFLSELNNIIANSVHRLVTGENLTSGTGSDGDTGSSELAEKQFFARANYLMKKMSEAWTRDVLPYIIESNKHWLEPADENHPAIWIEFRPPVEKQRITVTEMLQTVDRRIPLSLDYIYSALGTERPMEGQDVFVLPDAVTPTGSNVPNSAGGTQRSDREQKGSNVPADATRKQDKEKDIRNADKENK